MNTKSNLLKSIFISLILVMGVSNAWAVDHTGGYVYFLKPSTWTESKVMMFIGHDSYTSVYEMTKVSNTDNLYRYTMPSWRGATYVAFANAESVWGSGNWGPSNRTNAPHYTNVYNNYGFNSGSYYVVVPASTSNNAGLTINYKSSAANLNLKTEAIASDKAHGTVSVSGYYMSADNTASTRSAVSSSASNTTASTTLAPGSTATFKATASTGYEFEGWYDAATDGNQLSTKSTYTFKYDISYTGKTVYARFKAKQYTITYKDQGNVTFTGTHASGYPTKHTYGTATTLSTATKTGYTFGGWFTNSDCTETAVTSLGATDYTADITLYAKWTQNATYSLEVKAGTGIASVTGSTDPVTLGSSYAITATPETGYSFSTWTASPAANATFASATSASTNVTVKNGSVTVTASATENLYTITVQSSNNSHGTVTKSADKAGIATSITITATPESGYRFVNWTTATAGIAIADANNASTTITATAAGTVTANFEEIPLKTIYFLNKDNWSKVNVYRWGGSAAGDSWPGIEATKADFQLHCCDVYYVSALPGSYENCIFNNGSGSQTADLTWTADKYFYGDAWKILDELTYEVQLAGTMNNWTAESLAMADDNSTGSLTVNLDANQTYEFKIIVDNAWHGNTGTMTYGNSTDWTMSSSENTNCKITTAGSGNYTFTYNVCTAKVTVTYPTSYTVTYSRVPEAAADKPTTSPSVTSGKYVAEGTSVTFTAKDANNGYTWKGWYNNEAGDGDALTTDKVYTKSITANTTIYAVYTVNTYSITYNLNGGTNPNDAPTSYNVTTATFNLPTPTKTGYTFAGWYTTSDFSDNKVTQIAQGSTDDKEFWAKWTAIEYTITYNDLYDVTHSNPTAYTIESETITFTNPTSERTGYTFAGWNPTQIAQGSTGNKTVTAQWTEILSTITITTNPAEGGRIEVDGQPFTPGNTVQVGVTTTCTVTTTANEGYGVISWGVSNKDIVIINGGHTITLNSDGSGRDGTLTANYIPLSRNILFDKQSGEGGTETATVTYTQNDYEPASVIAPTRAGYNFGGYYSEEKGAGVRVVSAEGAWLSNANGYTDADGNWLKSAENTTLYAKWTANTYTVTLAQTGATTQGTPSVTATYDADMPSATMPTKTGYVFGGYYDQTEGQGTQYYKADGTSARTWNKAENTTLYAYFVTPQIEVTLNGSTFEPGTASVIATATVTPAPADGTTVVCWSLLYSGSENEVAGHEPTPTNGNSVQFSISDLAAGSYTIKAILREGTGCEGTEISSATKTFLITSSHTITIKYTCDGKEIQASTTQEAQVSSATTITAPDIVGYTFSNWEAGDGVTINGNTSNRTITYTAIYDGYLTAKYNVNNNIVYFKNTLGWNKVYVYTFSNNAWWDTGSVGVHPEANKLEQGEMIRMGDTDIYYFVLSNPDGDYTQENNANKNYIAFSNQDWRGKDAFNGGQAIYRGDHKNNLTLFIPQADQTPETYNNTKYYSTGIWMKYNSTESGYQIPSNLPGGDWNTYTDNFTTTNPGGYTFSITKNLAANTEYEFKIRNYVWIHNDWEDNGNGKDNNQWFGNNGNITASVSNWHFHDQNAEKKGYDNTKITTNAAGEYKFTIDLSTGKVLLSVEYPIAVGDYRVIYKDNATWSQGTTAHDANWYHPSRIIKKNKTAEPTKDIISFFISYGHNPTMQFQKVKSITNGNVTWEDAGDAKIPENITTSGVYNFVVIQNEDGTSISMENNAEPYTGNYYIRCDAVGGKWDNYKTDKENRMTYSAFSESDANSFGDKYSHYVTKYCPHSTNIKFTIANDYSPCISDTLVRDFGANNTVNPFGNLDENGTLIKDDNNNDKYSANVRFMWNHKTNKISRAYIGRAVTNDFLVIDGNKTLHNSKGTERDTIVFFDTQNWIYEVKMKVQPTTRVKVYAAYPAGVGESKAQYFCGAYNNDAFNDDEDSKLALGGDADDQNYYSIRVLYDFKTNRLLMAWMPSGDTENVDGTKTISADVMLIRDHQNPAQCITFANEDSKLSEVKTVYGSMRFNRWVLNNRGGQNNFDVNSCGGADSYNENTTNSNHPVLQPAEQKSQYERALYFISFPFNVNVSDIFGFGTYGQHWIIEYYDGLKRAREGFWIDSDPNWKYVTNPDEFVLEKYKGYILCLNLGKMAYNNTDFWAHNISQVELFFPSTTTMSEIKRTEVTMPALGDEYLCKINRNTPEGDRRVKDSYWRCIGVPSYANYSNILTDGEQQTIKWQTSYTTFPFLYAWNMTDNTLTPQSTTNFNFKTMHAYLVQNGGEIHWSAVSATPNQPSNIVARRQAADEVKNYEWKLTLSRNEQIEDQAFVRLSDNEQITTEFDFNQDLSKEFNYGRSDIYTLIGYEKAAANSLPITETTTLIPLGLSIEYNGDYTIAMPDRMENIGVTLIDTESNTRTNLSAGMEYVVTLNKGDYNNRFFIEISPAHQVPTDIDYITGDSNSQNSVRKVLIDNILYIVRDGQMFDARGARVK